MLNKYSAPYNPKELSEKDTKRNAFFIIAGLMVSAIISIFLLVFYGVTQNLPPLFTPAIFLGAAVLLDFVIIQLIKNNKQNLAMGLLLSSFVINMIVLTITISGLGVVFAATTAIVSIAILGLAVSTRYTHPGIIISFVLGIALYFFDIYLEVDRIQLPALLMLSPYIFILISTPIIFVFFREFNRFKLQVKISLGILITGGLTVFVIIAYGVNRANFIGNTLADRYENSVRKQTETELSTKIIDRAKDINNLLSGAEDDLKEIAGFRSSLETNGIEEVNATYWNAQVEMVRQPGGQYDNSNSDPGAVFIPNRYTLSDQLINNLNTSIYLNLVVPNVIEAHPEFPGVYYISKFGYTIYYPNIDLANNIDPGFDPTQELFYTIASPSNNPSREPRWTPPYEDPAGAGLIVTISIPVYHDDSFMGVMGADIKLSNVVNLVSSINITESGIPLLVDESGVIIAMSEGGYDFLGLNSETLEDNQSPSQNILDSPSEDIQNLALQIVSTDSGISKFNINGIETYVAVSTLDTTGYKLAYIAPASDLESEIVISRAEVDNQIRQSFQSAAVILALLFISAFLVSLLVGQVITRPLTRLIETVEQIAAGNLSSRASVETGDESGMLAKSFNLMADRLSQTLQGLEDRISERTSELEALNENSIYRASLFESIARISRIINTTKTLEQLLPQIAETISDQLGYYHVGIFLLDTQSEYAILKAANSEGGKVMLARNHRLRVGETGIVGYVTHSGTPRIALDVGQDAIFFNNPDLPETHSEVALPLRSGTEIIGALDVQSKLTNAFSDEDVNILSVLADQVSIAIQNANSFEQSREALQKAEHAAAQLSASQWSEFLKQKAALAFHYDGTNTAEVQPETKVQQNNLIIPILLRGAQIGTIKLSAPDGKRIWDDNEIAITQATAQRAALAIETARLLQDAQKQAAKERVIGDISSKIGSLVNIENIVQTTIQELGDTLPGTDVAIQFTTGQSG